ncbi:MAG: hypothetical protein [Inoviridae sp.]|nr:MAG: hypothetical protein [Inoviridae sp.]
MISRFLTFTSTAPRHILKRSQFLKTRNCLAVFMMSLCVLRFKTHASKCVTISKTPLLLSLNNVFLCIGCR